MQKERIGYRRSNSNFRANLIGIYKHNIVTCWLDHHKWDRFECFYPDISVLHERTSTIQIRNWFSSLEDVLSLRWTILHGVSTIADMWITSISCCSNLFPFPDALLIYDDRGLHKTAGGCVKKVEIMCWGLSKEDSVSSAKPEYTSHDRHSLQSWASKMTSRNTQAYPHYSKNAVKKWASFFGRRLVPLICHLT